MLCDQSNANERMQNSLPESLWKQYEAKQKVPQTIHAYISHYFHASKRITFIDITSFNHPILL